MWIKSNVENYTHVNVHNYDENWSEWTEHTANALVEASGKKWKEEEKEKENVEKLVKWCMFVSMSVYGYIYW